MDDLDGLSGPHHVGVHKTHAGVIERGNRKKESGPPGESNQFKP